MRNEQFGQSHQCLHRSVDVHRHGAHRRGEQYLLIKSPPASGKSRALIFIALDKLHNQGLRQAIVVAPQWNLCNAPGVDELRVAKSKVDAVRQFLASEDKALVCTHATFRFAVDELGVEAFDDCLIAVDELHHVSSDPDSKLGSQLGAFIARDKVHLVAMTGSYFRGDSVAVLAPADEGFDWIWCEHALTIGYRSSLTEIVQIIGRATRDAEGKERARFTNLIAEPAAEQIAVAEAVNDMLKAISASLLMEQVLAPRYEFTPKNQGPKEGFDYGKDGYQEGGHNIGVNKDTGQIHLEINGLATPQSPEATRICKEDLNEVVTSFLQDKTALERGLFDQENTLPEELTQLRMGKIVRERYPELSDADQEAIRQHAIAAMNITQQAKLALAQVDIEGAMQGTTALLDGVRKFVNVRDLDIDLIDRINPFDAAYAVLAKAMDEKSLRQVQASIAAKKVSISRDEAVQLADRARAFKRERGRLPDINSADAWEKRMAEGVAAFARYKAEELSAKQSGASNV
ncbi:MAG: hypothetical protein Q8M20_00855 [Rhodocyclaceae bacterium]|nr:hypothetical protein [Rhodocyclaceae bacterium]MDZ4214957.1 hypothetical protein [Rhodocyclaceae bacterium]